MLTEHHLLIFLAQLCVLLVGARSLGEVARKLGQPAIVGELLAGVLLGATVLGSVAPQVSGWLFPDDPVQSGLLQVVGLLGIVFLLLVAGIEVDLQIVRAQGKAALLTGALGLAMPFGLGLLLGLVLPESARGEHGTQTIFVIFVATAMSISAVPVIARILMDLQIFRTDIGLVIMASAMSNDIIGWVIFSVVIGMIGGSGLQIGHVMQVLVMTLTFSAVCLTVGRLIVHRVLEWVQDRLPWPGGVLTMAFSLALLCAAITQAMGIHAVFGAFLAGIMIGDSPRLREKTKEIIFQVTMSLFAPVFFATVGLHVNFIRDFDPVLVTAVLVVASAGKIAGCYWGARLGGMGKHDSLGIAYGMNARGAMEIILALLALNAGIISDSLFVALVIMAVVTSMVSGPLLATCLRVEPVEAAELSDFTLAAFEPELGGKSKREVIRQLVAQISSKVVLPVDVEKATKAVMLRENMMSTGMKYGFAVPHANVPGLEKPVLAFGRSSDGVDFDSPEGGMTHFVFLFLTPSEAPESNLALHASIARMMQSAQHRDQLYRADSMDRLKSVLEPALRASGM